MNVRGNGCLLSVVALLLLIPLGLFALLVFGLGFNDNGSQAGTAAAERGVLYLKIALGIITVLFLAGLVWALSGTDRDQPRYRRRPKPETPERPDDHRT